MPRITESLLSYCSELVRAEGQELSSGEILAKVLTKNDDSGRHGVVIPREAYDFFPALQILNPNENATTPFSGRDCLSHCHQELNYKYYQRYPERRVTCLNAAFNDRSNGMRVAVFLRAKHRDGTMGYYTDLLRQNVDGEFVNLCSVLFGSDLSVQEGLFLQRQLDSPLFRYDDTLTELIQLYDDVSNRGYITSLRAGDTGIGYTFETLVGVEENNDQIADFRGIEIKCKQTRENERNQGKINLFQKGPRWMQRSSNKERVRLIGYLNGEGRYACHSQVSTTANNLGLRLGFCTEQLNLLRNDEPLGYWTHPTLAKRLEEKHSRAVFVKADVRVSGGQQSFHYKELVYCENPSIDRFVELAQARKIVFEFLMSEKENGCVKNHGYPWRLTSEDYLSELFSLRVKLR